MASIAIAVAGIGHRGVAEPSPSLAPLRRPCDRRNSAWLGRRFGWKNRAFCCCCLGVPRGPIGATREHVPQCGNGHEVARRAFRRSRGRPGRVQRTRRKRSRHECPPRLPDGHRLQGERRCRALRPWHLPDRGRRASGPRRRRVGRFGFLRQAASDAGVLRADREPTPHERTYPLSSRTDAAPNRSLRASSPGWLRGRELQGLLERARRARTRGVPAERGG